MEKISITSEQRESLIRQAYWRGFRASAIVLGIALVLMFIVMANIIIYVGQ